MTLADQLAGVQGPPWQDYVVIGGQRTPGLAVVRNAATPRTWDVQQGYGLSGAVIYFTGANLAHFAIDVYAWEPAHFSAFDALAKSVLKPPAPVRVPQSLSVEHPVLNRAPILIFQAVVEDVSGWEENDDTGLWMCTIAMIAYRKPKPALVKPIEGPPGAQTATEKPVDPELAQIEANSKAIAELAK